MLDMVGPYVQFFEDVGLPLLYYFGKHYVTRQTMIKIEQFIS